jgi:hypothetical protein
MWKCESRQNNNKNQDFLLRVKMGLAAAANDREAVAMKTESHDHSRGRNCG